MLEEILAKLENIPAHKLDKYVQLAEKLTPTAVWYPHPENKPQCQAYYSKADIMLFGGSPGGGKTALGLGLALTQHRRSLIVRKQFTHLAGIVDNLQGMLGSSEGIVRGNRPQYKNADGRLISFEGMSGEGIDEGKQGNPFDLIYIDEGAQFGEKEVRLLIGWNRRGAGVPETQRCRVVIGSNPPTSPTGDWLGTFFAPWFDPKHPNPAKFGELRWFYFDEEGKGIETEHTKPFELNGKICRPHSRTYFFSSVDNNPYLDESYKKNLDSLPEPFRTQLLSGNFLAARKDQEYQAIPTLWVMKCIERFDKQNGKPLPAVPMCSMALDCAGGGEDNAVIATRYDHFFAPLEKFKTSSENAGLEMAAKVLLARKDQADIGIDMGGGYGGAVYEKLNAALPGIKINRYVGGSKSERRSPDGKRQYFNLRSQAYWEFRLAADPDQEGGSMLALPNDPRLIAGLTAVTYCPKAMAMNMIKMQPKEEVRANLKYSPDEADAVVMAWWTGRKNILMQDPGLSYGYQTKPMSYLPNSHKMTDKYNNRRGL